MSGFRGLGVEGFSGLRGFRDEGEPYIAGFRKLWGTLFGGPYSKDPTV